MTNKKILELLNDNKIEKLKRMIQDELKLESVKLGSAKSNFKKVHNYVLKKVERRPILKYCDFDKDNRQIFTDAYFFASLVKEDYNPLFEKLNGSEKNHYPDMNKITNVKSYQYHTTINYNEILDMIKNAKINSEKVIQMELMNDDPYDKTKNQYNFDIKLLEIALLSLNIKNKNELLDVKFSVPYYKPVNFAKSNGSRVMVCSLRKEV